MTISDEEIKIFFESRIFDLDENDVEIFFDKCDCEKVIKYLLDRLKLIAIYSDRDERSWRLGRVFGSIPKKYSADIKVYSLLNSCNDPEKEAMLNFISGYWYSLGADLDTLVEIFSLVKKAILNEIIWNKKLILIAIEAATIGYIYNPKMIEIDIDRKKDFDEALKLFKKYVSSVSIEHSIYNLLLNIT